MRDTAALKQDGMDTTARIVVGVQGDAVWSFPGRRPMVGGEDAPLPDRSRSAVQPVLDEETRAGRARSLSSWAESAPGSSPAWTKSQRPVSQNQGSSARNRRCADGHALCEAGDVAAGGTVAAWRVALRVPMPSLPFLPPKLPLFCPQGFQAAAAHDIMVAGDGGHGLAPLGDELEDAVE